MNGHDVLKNDRMLGAMIDAIVASVKPARVILFGSRARGDERPDSDYDLVVELDFARAEHSKVHGRASHAIHEVAGSIAVDLLLRAPDEIERRRDDPGYMDWDIAREGIVVYSRDAGDEWRGTRSPTASRVGERAPNAFGSIKDWLERIDQDLRMIDAALAQGESAAWGAAGFHAQQAAEKYLKILFIQRGIRPPRTHSLDLLIRELRKMNYQLPAFETECELLDPYAVAIRYPEDAPIPDEAEGRAVIAAARRIVGAVRALVRS